MNGQRTQKTLVEKKVKIKSYSIPRNSNKISNIFLKIYDTVTSRNNNLTSLLGPVIAKDKP